MKNLLAMALFGAVLLLAGVSVRAADAVSPSAVPVPVAPADAKKAPATDAFPEADEMPVPANATVSDAPHAAEITPPAASAPAAAAEMPATPAPAVEPAPAPEAQAPAEAAAPATTPTPTPATEMAAPGAEEKKAAAEEKTATEEKPAVDLPAASAPKAKKHHHAAKKAKAKAERASGAPFEVAGAYVFATAPTQKTGAAFMALQNTGKADATLIGAWSSVAEKVELHTTTMENGVMRMRPVDQFVIPVGGTLVMAPHSHHIMLIGLKEPLKVGDKLTIRLRFADGKSVDTLFDIVAPGAGAAEEPAAPMEMDHEGMMQGQGHMMSGHEMPGGPGMQHGPDGHEGMAHCDGMPCCDGVACDDMPEDAMPAEGALPPERPVE